MHYEDFKRKPLNWGLPDNEIWRRYQLFMEQEMFKQLHLQLLEAKGESSSSSSSASGGGERSQDRILPPFGVNEFITTWKTDNTGASASNQIQLPLGVFAPSTGYDYYFQVDWGDGSTNIIQSASDPARIHTYNTAGTYTVKISGILDGWSFNNGGDRLKLLAITQWGMMKVATNAQFAGCANLQVSASDLPTLIDMSATFWNCTALTNVSRISEWDVSNVRSMFQCFRGCSNFNDDVTGWDVSNLRSSFRLFMSTPFNRNLGNWNMSNNQFFNSMFNGASSFNNGGSPSINNWNTSNVLGIEEMFRGASSFNQPIGNWDMSKVTTMRSVFRDSPFNQNVSGWNTVSVTRMDDLFLNNSGGNQDFTTWDFTKVTTMSRFSQSLSVANYNILLLNLANSSTLRNNVPLQVNAQYSTTGSGNKEDDPAAARAYIISTYAWSISDGGLQP